jgi:hypothetical protein
MRQKGVLFFVASWLVVRLRLALLSTKSLLPHLPLKSGIILVAKRREIHTEDSWRWDGARLHFIHLENEDMRLQIRSFESSNN